MAYPTGGMGEEEVAIFPELVSLTAGVSIRDAVLSVRRVRLGSVCTCLPGGREGSKEGEN